MEAGVEFFDANGPANTKSPPIYPKLHHFLTSSTSLKERDYLSSNWQECTQLQITLTVELVDNCAKTQHPSPLVSNPEDTESSVTDADIILTITKNDTLSCACNSAECSSQMDELDPNPPSNECTLSCDTEQSQQLAQATVFQTPETIS